MLKFYDTRLNTVCVTLQMVGCSNFHLFFVRCYLILHYFPWIAWIHYIFSHLKKLLYLLNVTPNVFVNRLSTKVDKLLFKEQNVIICMNGRHEKLNGKQKSYRNLISSVQKRTYRENDHSTHRTSEKSKRRKKQKATTHTNRTKSERPITSYE